MAPYGMPRLSPKIQRTVCFIYGINPKTGVLEPAGSGALLGIHHPKFDPMQAIMRHVYVVTCAHVVREGGLTVRINTKGGDSRYIDLELNEWVFSHETDLATADITDYLTDADEIALIPETWLVTKLYLQHSDLNIGEDGFMMGLFADVPGGKRNAVAARFGNISLLASDGVLIKHTDGKSRPAHVFDLKSRPGFSGSPVFVYRTPSGDLRKLDQGFLDPNFNPSILPGAIGEMDSQRRLRDNMLIKLLGIHIAQYHDTVRAYRDSSISDEASGAIRDGDILRIPNSMSLIAPGEAVQQLLHYPTLVERRAIRDSVMGDEPEHLLAERSLYSGWSTY